jgi:hypothetical protein
MSLPVAGEQQVWLEDLSTTTCYSTPDIMLFSQSLHAAVFQRSDCVIFLDHYTQLL